MPANTPSPSWETLDTVLRELFQNDTPKLEIMDHAAAGRGIDDIADKMGMPAEQVTEELLGIHDIYRKLMKGYWSIVESLQPLLKELIKDNRVAEQLAAAVTERHSLHSERGLMDALWTLIQCGLKIESHLKSVLDDVEAKKLLKRINRLLQQEDNLREDPQA